MIFPSFFPQERDSEFAEKKVFEKLKTLENDFDIFYSQKFIGLSNKERPEYEIDFIIAKPRKVILCLEVKGGKMHYDGASWQQNGRIIKDPCHQASGAVHSLVQRFANLAKDVIIDWALCFPDCTVLNPKSLPSVLSLSYKLIDSDSLFYIGEIIKDIFSQILQRFPTKTGCSQQVYDNFKNTLLKDLSFFQPLSTQMLYDEERIVELTNRQYELYLRGISNQKIISSGPAGCGKTLIAKTLAKDFYAQYQRVLFLCFNKTLGNLLRRELKASESFNSFPNKPRFVVCNFHKFAMLSVNYSWWEENKNNEGFYDIEVPIQLDSNQELKNSIDVLIIDEAQDFNEYWFEVLFKMVTPTGKIILFQDKQQDIFNRNNTIPNSYLFFKYELDENCRNTKKIVKSLENIVQSKIKVFEKSPEGTPIVYRDSKNNIEQQKLIIQDIKDLVSLEKISPEKILILSYYQRSYTCLSNLNSIGSWEVKELDDDAKFQPNTIHYTTIGKFKGLECDVVIVPNLEKIRQDTEAIKKIYTIYSRAKHKLFIYQNPIK